MVVFKLYSILMHRLCGSNIIKQFACLSIRIFNDNQYTVRRNLPFSELNTRHAFTEQRLVLLFYMAYF